MRCHSFSSWTCLSVRRKSSFFPRANQMWLFILPPDTSGVTQLHDQINNRLHDEYEKSKSELYSEMSNLNRESFMTILGDAWNKWATPDLILKSGKRFGISINGLNVNWMQQDNSDVQKLFLNQQSPHHLHLLLALFYYHTRWSSKEDICILSAQI